MDFNPNHCQITGLTIKYILPSWAELMCPVLACQALNSIITRPTVTKVFIVGLPYLIRQNPGHIFGDAHTFKFWQQDCKKCLPLACKFKICHLR